MITLRLVEENDIDQYRRLRLEALAEHPDAFGASVSEERANTVKDIWNRVKPTESSWVLGAFKENGELIGMIGWFRQSQIKLNHKSMIWGMYVSSEFKGQGVGKKLLVEAIKRISQVNGIEQIQLTVTNHNTRAKKLYVGLGFEPFGLEKNALKYGDQYYNEDHMVLFL